MLNNSNPYVAIDFDENISPQFQLDSTLNLEHHAISDIGSISLNITHFGDFDRIPVITSLSNDNQRNRWIKINNKWHKFSTPIFSIHFDQQWIPTLFDGNGNEVTEVALDINALNHEKICSFDNISLLQAFGSCKKVIKIGPFWYVIDVPC